MNYVPAFTTLPGHYVEAPGLLISECGEHYSTSIVIRILHNISKLPPFPYMSIVEQGKSYVPFPASVMNELCKLFLAGRFEKYCSELVSDTSYNEACLLIVAIAM